MRIIIITIIAALSIGASCHQEATQQQTNLTGKWKFTEYLQDPGDGSGKWAPAPTGETYIEFRKDSTIATDVSQLQGYNRYTSLTKDEITLPQSSGTNVKFKYSIKGNTLELRPPCREACGLRFTR